MNQHSRQESMASSYVSSNAMGNSSNPNVSAHSTSTNKSKNPIKIGPWKLGKTLGKGSTGRVLLATNINNGQKAAVKVVSKSLLNNELGQNQNAAEEDEERDCDSAGLSYGIEREIIIMKLLNHKNVLRLYDVWETDNALYLVLEYVEGGELFDLLVESGPLPENTAIEFFKQIILGASYCHNLGICHRDLKPENLLLDKNYNIKIADFGMAALESNDRLLETSCGSPHYAAPEIVSGLQYHGAESDVWSCGVILFALLTGRLPFDDDNIRELLLKVQKGQYELVEDISPEAVDLIGQMLTVDPTQRIKTRDIFRHPLIQKYPFSDMELQDYNDLPSPTCATRPVRTRAEIDEQILENLVILWHGRDVESIIDALLSPEANSEKTFYSLLLRYRHDHSSRKSNRQSLQRTSSAVTKSTSDMSITSTSTNKKSKRSSQNFSASSSRKRVSFQSNKTITPSKSSTPTKRNSLQESNNLIGHQQQLKTAATVAALHAPGLSSNPSVSKPKPAPLHFRSSLQAEPLINNTKRTSMMSTKSNRSSMLFMNDNKGNRNSMILSDAPNAFRRNSAHISPSKKRTSRKMRNSVTSKLLSTYAKLADMDESQSDKLDKKVRRTSADFATLCDMLFNDDVSPKKKSARLPNSETMNTMKAILFAEESSENKRASMGPSKSKRNSLVQAKKRQSTISHNSGNAASVPVTPITPTTTTSNKRATSNPLERISRILNNNDLENNKRRSMSSRLSSSRLSMRSSRPPSIGPPPKPASKLDPRYKVYHDYEKRKSAGSTHLLSSVGEYETVKPEKFIDETETVLGSERGSLKSKIVDDEYEDVDADTIVGGNASKSVDSLNKFEDVESPTSSTSASSADKLKKLEQRRNKSGASVVRQSGPISIADIKVPQVTRRSKNFPDNRLSVLSLYSTKHSSTRLSAYLNDIDLQLKEQNDKNKNQNRNTSATALSKGTTRMSMMFTEDDVVDMDVTFDSNATSTQDNSTIKRDLLSDDDLCFVNKNTPPKHKQTNSVILTGLDQIPALKYKESKDTLMSVDDGDMDDSNFDGAASSGHKLPEIPGSPIKEEQKRKSLQSNFEIFEDGSGKEQHKPLESKPQQNQNRKSSRKSYAVDDVDQIPTPEINSNRLPLQGNKFNNPSLNSSAPTSARLPTVDNPHVELAVNKKRQPLGDVNQNKANDDSNTKRKGSFFRKLSLGKSKQEEVKPGSDENGKRKVSLTQAFIALFTGHEEVPTKDITTMLTQGDLYEALKSLLISWKQHGITNTRFDPFNYKIAATISKKNALGLKACKFGCEVVKVEEINKNGKVNTASLTKSKIVFSNLKGSGKSFNRLVSEITSILEKESILVN